MKRKMPLKHRWRQGWRTAFVRITGRCPDCRAKVSCGPGHGRRFVDAYYDDFMESGFSSCGKCVVEYGTALGSILHQCASMADRIAQADAAHPRGIEGVIEDALRQTGVQE